MLKLSAVLIALNEEKNIEACLASLQFCDEMVVVDSGSQDATVLLAKKSGAKVYRNRFVDFASQKNFAIEKASSEWLLLIDADERVPAALACEIKKELEHPRAEGYYLKRFNRIFGRWMRHGANHNDRQLRLVRKDKAVFRGLVHERIFLNKPVPTLKNSLEHLSTESIQQYIKKLNHYTGLEAERLLNEKEPVSVAKMKIKPCLVFFRSAIWHRGFLDGVEGWFFNILSAYYEFLSLVRCWELKNREGISPRKFP